MSRFLQYDAANDDDDDDYYDDDEDLDLTASTEMFVKGAGESKAAVKVDLSTETSNVIQRGLAVDEQIDKNTSTPNNNNNNSNAAIKIRKDKVVEIGGKPAVYILEDCRKLQMKEFETVSILSVLFFQSSHNFCFSYEEISKVVFHLQTVSFFIVNCFNFVGESFNVCKTEKVVFSRLSEFSISFRPNWLIEIVIPEEYPVLSGLQLTARPLLLEKVLQPDHVDIVKALIAKHSAKTGECSLMQFVTELDDEMKRYRTVTHKKRRILFIY